MTTILLSALHHAGIIIAILAIVGIGIYAIGAALYAFSFTSKKS